MAEHNEIGSKGEALAKGFLVKQGYKILHSNWRRHRCELDLVALHQDFIVFVEVKTRSSSYLEDPRNAVNKKKRKEVIKAANLYLEEMDESKEARFDIVEVILGKKQPKINVIEDAFNAVG